MNQTTTTPWGPLSGKAVHARRVYSALVFLPLFYLLVRYGPPVGFFLLVLAASMLALTEFYRLHFAPNTAVLDIGLGLAGTGLLLMSMYQPDILSSRTVLAMILMGALTVRLLPREPSPQTLMDIALLLLGVLYVGLLLGHFILTRALPSGEWLIFFVISVTWAGDTGAFYFGKTFGRLKLAPRISPNKTVEGLLGGLLFSLITAFIAKYWFVPSFSPADCVALGLLLSLAGLLGDLTESAFKRSAGVKDSGSLIPGHGGMLDRIDSLLFAAPTFYYYVTLVKG